MCGLKVQVRSLGRASLAILCGVLLWHTSVAFGGIPASSPNIVALFKTADFNDPEKFTATAAPTVGFLQVEFKDDVMTDGTLYLKIAGVQNSKPIYIREARGKEQRVPIDLTQFASGPQDITVLWVPGPNANRDLAESNKITVDVKKAPSAAPAPTPSRAPKPTITGLFDPNVPNDQSAKTQTNLAKAQIAVTFSDTTMTDGNLQVQIDNWIVNVGIKKDNGKSQRVLLDFSGISMTQNRKLIAIWDPNGDGEFQLPSSSSDPISVNIDTVSPRVTSIRQSGQPGGNTVLEINFAERDLATTPATEPGSPANPASYLITRAGGRPGFESLDGIPNFQPRPNAEGNKITIDLGALAVDSYQLIIRGVQDSHGNVIVPEVFQFTPVPSGDNDNHVPFPEYTVRPLRNKKEIFNPGDRVETRVARLYYYRNAHHVAQIINRNVQSYNQVAVGTATRAAEDARNLAEGKAADRKQKEAAAIRAAEKTRAAERELAAARKTLEDIRAVNAQATLGANAATQAATTSTRQASPEVSTLNRQVQTLTTRVSSLATAISRDQAALANYDMQIATLQEDIAGLKNATSSPANTDALTQKEADLKSAEARRKTITDRLPTELSDFETASAQIDDLNAQLAALSNASTDLTAASTALGNRAQLAKTATTEFVAKVSAMEAAVGDAREQERNAQAAMDAAQEVEDRAREDQFRKELALSLTDPNTYVAGDVESRDPVTQVSVSVIGEGLIHLRGPIRGINKIRTMINQIDAPVGQVKVGIFTVQINGEHEDRMEKVAARIEGNIDISRYLTNQSLGLLRRSIQEVAALVIKHTDLEMRGNRQVDRDRRYLYAFFGRDFVDELYEMDSEFLHTENKLLSLHSMDTSNQSQAFFILALAKNDVRQMILERFRYLIQCEMPCLEWDFRRSANMTRKAQHYKLNSLEEVTAHVQESYHFNNLHGFFNALVDDSDTMTPMQREFIRLAQIMKSKMVAELEYKQRVIERGLIEDQANTEEELNNALDGVRSDAQSLYAKSIKNLVLSQDSITRLTTELTTVLSDLTSYNNYTEKAISPQDAYVYDLMKILDATDPVTNKQKTVTAEVKSTIAAIPAPAGYDTLIATYLSVRAAAEKDRRSRVEPKMLPQIRTARESISSTLLHILSRSQMYPADFVDDIKKIFDTVNATRIDEQTLNEDAAFFLWSNIIVATKPIYGGRTRSEVATKYGADAVVLWPFIRRFLFALSNPSTTPGSLEKTYAVMKEQIRQLYPDDAKNKPIYVTKILADSDVLYRTLIMNEDQIARSKAIERRLRKDIDHRKLLEFLTDEQEEKFIELEESFRSHISHIDNYLKRLAIALEDDFKVQFYDPAFAQVRIASRAWDVNLGQIERTTILTNNRALAKVSPQATMEFDLPKRDILITEAMGGAKSLVNEYGTLLQDPTFLSATALLSGSPAVTGVAPGTSVPGLPGQGFANPAVRNVLPGQSTDSAEQLMAQTGGPARVFGSEFEKLIPDPAIYKVETGTGFEIRPVIQPDGNSIIYDFDYMYTTNIREPVRPDEKHIGRVKRHLIHTEVQTSSFELREISRYQVALKLSRTGRGVPLLQDVPGLGAMFRPLPSAESSLQQNIILGQSTVYPTLFDLMGLRWSKHVVDLDHVGLRDLEHVVRGRNTTIHDFTFDEGSRRVDDFLDIKNKDKERERPDLYHQQRQVSPYHPGGYRDRKMDDNQDPTGHEFDRPERRPEEFQEPPYDRKYRVPYEQLRTRDSRPEAIDIQPEPTAPQLIVPPSGAVTNPDLRSGPEEIQIMKYEQPASAAGERVLLPTPASKAPPSSTKPRMLKLPTIGSRKK